MSMPTNQDRQENPLLQTLIFSVRLCLHFSSDFAFSKPSQTASNLASLKGDFVQIMHIDVNNSKKISLDLSPYEITCLMVKIYSLLSDEFLKKGCLTFFIGGDNFMVISNDTTKEEAETIIDKVGE